jgi:dipeptidyl aminopeptidase/acylaminoacyl peptidase
MFRNHRECRLGLAVLLAAGCCAAISAGAVWAGGLTFEQLAALRSVGSAVISPDGVSVAYTLNVPRRPGRDDDGPAWVELHVISANGLNRTYVGGKVTVSHVRFTPDGSLITYLAKRNGDEHAALWAIPLTGGESCRLVSFPTDITDYRVSPDGSRLAFVAKEAESEQRIEAEKEGYSQ